MPPETQGVFHVRDHRVAAVRQHHAADGQPHEQRPDVHPFRPGGDGRDERGGDQSAGGGRAGRPVDHRGHRAGAAAAGRVAAAGGPAGDDPAGRDGTAGERSDAARRPAGVRRDRDAGAGRGPGSARRPTAQGRTARRRRRDDPGVQEMTPHTPGQPGVPGRRHPGPVRAAPTGRAGPVARDRAAATRGPGRRRRVAAAEKLGGSGGPGAFLLLPDHNRLDRDVDPADLVDEAIPALVAGADEEKDAGALPTVFGAAVVALGGYQLALRTPDRLGRNLTGGPPQGDGQGRTKSSRRVIAPQSDRDGRPPAGRPSRRSKPDLQPAPERLGQPLLDDPLDLVGVQPGAEVRGDDHLVLEPVGPLDACRRGGCGRTCGSPTARSFGRDERHLEDQDLGPVDLGQGVEARRRRIAQVGDLGNADLGRDLDAREPQVADLVVADQVLILGLELLPALPDEVTRARGSCAGWRTP